jgi:TIR domain
LTFEKGSGVAGIFISYRRKDAGGYAGRLHDELVRRYGRDAVFMDIDSISGGVDFKQRIHEALEASEIALVLIGEAWTAPGADHETRRIDSEDDLVRREVAAALAHENVVVVPVVVEGARLPEAADLPPDVSSLPALEICQLRNREWKQDIRRIYRTVDGAVEERPLQRLSRRMREMPGWAPLAGIGLLILVAGVIALASGGGGGSEACRNLDIPPASRERLAEAAGSARQAEQGSVYYGSCGSRTYALAAFPDGTDGVFVQSGVEWVDLGPTAAEKCARIPVELLESWKQDDC